MHRIGGEMLDTHRNWSTASCVVSALPASAMMALRKTLLGACLRVEVARVVIRRSCKGRHKHLHPTRITASARNRCLRQHDWSNGKLPVLIFNPRSLNGGSGPMLRLRAKCEREGAVMLKTSRIYTPARSRLFEQHPFRPLQDVDQT